MIGIRDICIGDYFDVEALGSVRIVAVSGDGTCTFVTNDGTPHNRHISSLRGIPITSDLLQRNGFVVRDNELVADVTNTDVVNAVIRTFHRADVWTVLYIIYGLGYIRSNGKCRIQNMHELQHCIELWKITKTLHT